MTHFSRVLADKRGIVGALMIGAIAVVALYAVAVFPLEHQVRSAELTAHTTQDALRKARLDYQNARATVTGKQQADASLQKFYQDVLPKDAGDARRLTFTRLSQLADQARVRLDHGTNVVEHEKGSQLSKLTTTYVLTGEYRDVRRFIYSLETAPQFMILEKVGLSASPDVLQQNRGIAVTLDIATYFRTGDVAD